MASIKYCSSISSLSVQKYNFAYINSGGTHHFFHSRSVLQTYEKIDVTDVGVAPGISMLVGNRLVILSIEDDIKLEAYHAPQFESNIISMRMLSFTYEVTFLGHRKDYIACFHMDTTTKRTVAEYPLVQNIYPKIMGNEGNTMRRSSNQLKGMVQMNAKES